MSIKRLLSVWLLSGVPFAPLTHAEVRLPRLLSDHMVLQRDSKIHIWGWADPGETIAIRLAAQGATATANRLGKWSVFVGPFPAGGPYDMTVTGKNTVIVHDILFGDVWVASGQSNMEFPMTYQAPWLPGVNNADWEVVNAHLPDMRLVVVEKAAALRPKEDITSVNGWRPVTPQTVATFSAVGYLFGRELHERYHIPIGIIESSWGGTVAEAWASEQSLEEFPEFKQPIESLHATTEQAALADLDRYHEERAAWDEQHASEDRGYVDGRPIWADPSFNASSWPKIDEPQRNPEPALKGFSGAVWFRRDIIIPPAQEGKAAQIHLGGAVQTDITYFNGKEIGETKDWYRRQDYIVPVELLKAGRNVITIRLTGADGHVGMFGFENPEDLNIRVGDMTLPLAGEWSYESSSDLSTFPAAPLLARLKESPNTPTALFNGMISPLVPFTIRGVIWYQGESNVDRAGQYKKLFPALIEDWRRHWGYQFPFLFVQLAGFGHNRPDPAEYSWADLREAQTAALSLPATAMATAVDVGEENSIHPRDKQDVAHRLAMSAATIAYSEKIVSSGPSYSSMQIEGDYVRIKLSNVGSGLLIKDKYGYIRGFEVAGADARYHWAQARLDGKDLIVFNPAVHHARSVRYDWSSTPDGNVYNKEGFPAVPFRTDVPWR